MPLTQQQLADPELRSRISRLELHARLVVEGVISGLHRSPYHGFSVEFAQHREYTPGDEIRTIDWRVLARSDRYYVKEFEEETNLKAYLLLDASSSMDYAGERRRHTKREYASVVAAALAQLMIQQRDAVGLAVFDEGVRSYLPPRSLASHYKQMLETMLACEPRPKTNLAATFHELADQVKRRGLIIVLSDLFGEVEDILMGLRHFRHRKHEVIVFHVLDDDEIEFPFTDLTRFEGLEREPEVLVDPRGIRTEYQRQINLFCERLERGCREMQIDLTRLNTKDDPAQQLARYLASRLQRRG
ncbi:MAG: DUF58 domain-containing protein [Armatimonadetes bacterium]|nr:DUF58 domain-containing protein [Armatimonadota bacterium]